MTRFRTFRNQDSPALARLWNKSAAGSACARPLRVHELDAHAWGTVNFEPAGLIIAEIDGQIAGFAHAGFGPDLPVQETKPFQLCHELGAIRLLMIDPELDTPDLARELVFAAERYLAARGARVIYAGGVFPLNPFYWGVQGGSEGSGVLSGEVRFHRALEEAGYEPAGSTVLLEADLEKAEPRDPRAVLIRRHTQVDFVDDALPDHWWEGLALADFQIMKARLLQRSDGAELARAETWDMSWFGRVDGRTRIGLIGMDVAANYRRKGFGRFLVTEIFRRAREHFVNLVEVQTASDNTAALAFYEALGFAPIDEATLYRLPASLQGRTRSA
jgi:ribosomal protein S18 acetylase RimI-like enzyme